MQNILKYLVILVFNYFTKMLIVKEFLYKHFF